MFGAARRRGVGGGDALALGYHTFLDVAERVAFNDDVTEKIIPIFFFVRVGSSAIRRILRTIEFGQKAIHYSESQFLFCKYFPHLKYDYSKLVCVMSSASVGGLPLLAKKMVGASCAAHARRGGLSVSIQCMIH